MPGRHVIANALASLAAASVWGIGIEEARTVLPSLRPPAMRGELLQIFRWSGADQRQLQLQPCGAAGDDAAAGGYARIPPPDSGCRRNARTGADFGGAASRSGPICRAHDAKAGKIDWIIGVAGDAAQISRRRGDRWLAARRTLKFFPSSEEAAKFLARLRAVRRCAAGQRLPRREDGTHRRRVARAQCPARQAREEARH